MNTLYIINVVMIAINAFLLGVIWDDNSYRPLVFLINLAAVALNIVTVSQVLING
jgi:hypothetical protein